MRLLLTAALALRAPPGLPAARRRASLASMQELGAEEPVVPVDVEPMDAAMDSNAEREREWLTQEFIASALEVDRGFQASAEQRESLRSLAEGLEALNAEAAPVDSPLLLGKWQLAFTDAFDVLNLRFAPAEVGEISQELLAEEGALKALNRVELQPLGADLLSAALGLRAATTYTVTGVCRALSPTRLSLLFVGGSFAPELQLLKQGFEPSLPPLASELPQPLVGALQDLFGRIGEPVYLETTFLSPTLRIARGPGREVWVLRR